MLINLHPPLLKALHVAIPSENEPLLGAVPNSRQYVLYTHAPVPKECAYLISVSTAVLPALADFRSLSSAYTKL